MERQTVRSASRLVVYLIRLPRCYYYTTCKWCMESHLSSDEGVLLALVPWPPCAVCAARVAAGCVREPGLAVCPASWPACVPVAWCCALPCSLVCGPAMLALWAGLVRVPCLWASYKPLLYGPVLRPCISGLIWASEKVLYFRLVFRLCISVLFPGFVFALKFPARFSGFQRLDFFLRIFRVDFSGENFPDIFSGFYFPAFFLA